MSNNNSEIISTNNQVHTNNLVLVNKVDVEFVLRGDYIPVDHAHQLFGAVATALNMDIHNAKWLAIQTIRGELIRDRILINNKSRLKLRVDVDRIPTVLKLIGKKLNIDQQSVLVNVANIKPIVPAQNLHARLVVIKEHLQVTEFVSALFKQLNQMNIPTDSLNIIVTEKPKIVRVHNKKIVGYGVTIANLTSEQSLAIQTEGLGGKRRMGCGIFVPTVMHY